MGKSLRRVRFFRPPGPPPIRAAREPTPTLARRHATSPPSAGKLPARKVRAGSRPMPRLHRTVTDRIGPLLRAPSGFWVDAPCLFVEPSCGIGAVHRGVSGRQGRIHEAKARGPASEGGSHRGFGGRVCAPLAGLPVRRVASRVWSVGLGRVRSGACFAPPRRVGLAVSLGRGCRGRSGCGAGFLTQRHAACGAGRFILHGSKTFEKAQDTRCAQSVKDLGTAFFVLHDAGLAQQGQMPRDGGHAHAQQGGQLTDAPFPAGQFLDDEESTRVPERFEHAGWFLPRPEACSITHGCIISGCAK